MKKTKNILLEMQKKGYIEVTQWRNAVDMLELEFKKTQEEMKNSKRDWRDDMKVGYDEGVRITKEQMIKEIEKHRKQVEEFKEHLLRKSKGIAIKYYGWKKVLNTFDEIFKQKLSKEEE